MLWVIGFRFRFGFREMSGTTGTARLRPPCVGIPTVFSATRSRNFAVSSAATSICSSARRAPMDDCVDDATFDNGSGATCAAYSQWCADGGARPGSEWALGAQFNHPERHCCACGKPGAAEEAETH